jgi:arabinose-5-phosphate isomerase
MTARPKRINRTELAARALQQMEQFSITSLFTFDDDEAKRPVGIIHLHDLLKAGIA